MSKPDRLSAQTDQNKDFTARLMAVQACYQRMQADQPLRDVMEEYLAHRKEIRTQDDHVMVKPNTVLFKKILTNLDARKEDIEALILGNLPSGRDIKDIEPLLKAIMQCGISEIIVENENRPLIINDYLNVCHSFYDKNKVSFVNGILDSIAKILKS